MSKCYSLLLGTFFFVSNVLAQTDIYVRGSGKLFPVAIPDLCVEGGSPELSSQIAKTLARDLELSGYFEVVKRAAYLENSARCAQQVVYSDWSVIGSEGLVKGTVTDIGGQAQVKLFLHDVQRQKVVLGKAYEGDSAQANKIAHRFANEIMRFFTGEQGVFGTQIAFSSKVGRFKELFVMDMDGSNARQLTNDRGLAVSAGWHPQGRKLVFTAYKRRVPDLFSLDIYTKEVRQLTRDATLEVGGKWSKNGQALLTSVTNGVDADIVLLSADGILLKRLTAPNGAIDVSPDWSPDGSQITFVSNRGGGPQIYVMSSDGSGARRISFVSSNYCTSPVWSPKGDKIAFVCRSEGGFHIYTTNPDGSDPVQLTAIGSNEDPDWSPNGRYLVYSSNFGRGYVYGLALMRSDGLGMHRLTSSRGGDHEPAWGPLIE